MFSVRDRADEHTELAAERDRAKAAADRDYARRMKAAQVTFDAERAAAMLEWRQRTGPAGRRYNARTARIEETRCLPGFNDAPDTAATD